MSRDREHFKIPDRGIIRLIEYNRTWKSLPLPDCLKKGLTEHQQIAVNFLAEDIRVTDLCAHYWMKVRLEEEQSPVNTTFTVTTYFAGRGWCLASQVDPKRTECDKEINQHTNRKELSLIPIPDIHLSKLCPVCFYFLDHFK